MRLDRTKIAIRERSLFDLLDMALRVLFVHAAPLLIGATVMILPLMLLNWWLLGWMTDIGDAAESWPRYFWTMILLVIVEVPLVSICMTPYLGQVMFAEEVDWQEVRKTIWQSLFTLGVSHLLVRGIAFGVLLAWWIPRGESYSMPEFWLVLVAFYAAFMRAGRPFINEIILLERNPIRSKDPEVMTVRRRSSLLHGPNSGDLISRWLGCALVAVLLTLSTLATLWFLWGMMLFDWNWGPVMLHFCFPLSLWIVAFYFTVVRFLSYLDLRIRREGWEVELVMRAAAARMAESLG